VSDVGFSGERLDASHELFGADLARHRAAYRFALRHARVRRILDLGCGTGYGTAELAPAAELVVGVDRTPLEAGARDGGPRYVRADVARPALAEAAFDLVVSFQVIEHLEDPSAYLAAIARLLHPDGIALLTTPNRLTSDGENPFHVHEYLADELQQCLHDHFGEVEMRGVGASAAAAAYLEERLRRIRRIVRLDPLRLRQRLPRALVEWLFGRFALRIRRGIQRADGLPELDVDDFPVGPPDPACIDLLAVCRRPRVPASGSGF
jgi:SAM-dependent methyltransferase